MNQKLKYTGLALAGLAVIAAVVFFPVLISHVQDGRILNITHLSAAEGTALGYRHELSVQERLDLLSRSQYGNVLQRYEYRPSSYLEKEHAVALAKEQVGELKKRGILPDFSIDLDKTKASAQLFSYIDLNAPSLNVSLWQIELYFNNGNGYIYIDLDTKVNKIYNFQMNGEGIEASLDVQQAARNWGDYLGISFIKAEDESDKWGFDKEEVQRWHLDYEQEQEPLEYTYLITNDKSLINLFLNNPEESKEAGATDTAIYGWPGKNQSVKVK